MTPELIAMNIVLSLTNALIRARQEKRELTADELVKASQGHDDAARAALQQAIADAKSKQVGGG